MNPIKCECGHANPFGIAFCEACGKMYEEGLQRVIDMRYEGIARRSQTYNKTIVDKVWSFFSSVKTGVWLIFITLAASAIGTILPQEMYIPQTMPAEQYYENTYGWIGSVYYQLGLHHVYSSWWYLLLLSLIGISLVICSLDRAIPLYKALKAQKVTRHEEFLKRQRLFGVTSGSYLEDSLLKAKSHLQAKHYRVREENGNLFAEKNRFSRWGPYVNHIGLIIFLIGAMLRVVPGMYVDKMLWIREGETKVIPGTNGQFFLTNHQFVKQDYTNKDNPVYGAAIERVGMVPKNYQSNVTLYQAAGSRMIGESPVLQKIKDFHIRVNQPLHFNGYSLYQVNYKLNELNQMIFTLINKQTNQAYGDLSVNLYDPQLRYDLGKGFSVELLSYFPDFEYSERGEPTTKSRIPNNPAFVFRMKTPDKPKGETSFAAVMQTIEPFGNNEYKMKFKGVATKNVSGLTVRKDQTLWVVILGGLIFMIGVVQGAYWNHRRIWIQQKNGELWISAHTNKNWFGLKKEMETILEGTHLSMPMDQLQPKKNEQGGIHIGYSKQ